MKKIVLTGGGTAGHISPNLALLPALRAEGYDILYIGSKDGMEVELIQEAGVAYEGISSGKLRRYFDWKNFTDPFRVIKGFFEAFRILREYRPDVVFSKGGYVSVPVVVAAGLMKIPVAIHESDMTPGLANKIAFLFCRKAFCNFPETLPYLPSGKGAVSGCPIRSEILSGSREEGLRFTGLSGSKPVLLVTGGSLGSDFLNKTLRAALPELLPRYDIVHLCGRGHLQEDLSFPGYVQYEYISEQMKDLFALADIVISRAGANAICEILALHKPNLLIPISAKITRGDQVLNAASFKKQGFSMMLEEEEIREGVLTDAIRRLDEGRKQYITAMESSHLSDANAFIVSVLNQMVR